MPLHDLERVEYNTEHGHIRIVTDSGRSVPAYWAHPRLGTRFSGVCLVHDWWGLNDRMRVLANFFAHMGYYVIMPDLFDGQTTTDARTAMRLLEQSEQNRYDAVDATLDVLENHHRTYRTTAVVGVGMGGSLAYEVTVKRTDIEAAVSFAGFPHRYLKDLAATQTPTLAFYGDREPHITPPVISALRQQLAASPIASQHRVEVIAGADHDLLTNDVAQSARDRVRNILRITLDFLDDYLQRPQQPQRREPR